MNLLLQTTHQTPGGPVSFREFAPSRPLRPYVVCFWNGDKRACQPSSYAHCVLPDGCSDIIFDLQPDSPGAVVIGPMCRPRLVASDTKPALGIRFFPGAALTFLDIPLAELQEKVVPLDRFHTDIGLLLERLLATSTLDQQVALVENWLLSLLRRPRTDHHVTRAIKLTYAERGRLQVSELAEAVGLCVRQLCRKFPTWTGYSPKQFVRLMRFQHALEGLTFHPEMKASDTAAMHGYADQAHMIREFCEFAGESPGAVQRTIRGGDVECPIFSIPTPGTLRYHREP